MNARIKDNQPIACITENVKYQIPFLLQADGHVINTLYLFRQLMSRPFPIEKCMY